MLYGAPTDLEIRSEGGATRLRGAFAYNVETELGAGRRERIAPHAFRASLDGRRPVYLLAGHDPERPLASVAAGSLTLHDGDDALHVEATVEPVTSWAKDALAALQAGLTRGLSPGFRVTRDAVAQADGGLLRTVHEAELFELSLVTRPAYDTAQISARRWSPDAPVLASPAPALRRWRA